MISSNKNKENAFKYAGLSSLKDIEERLLEIDAEKSGRIHNAKENPSDDIYAFIEADDIDYLDVEKTQLQLKRQFILDERNDWKAKSIWNVIVPIFVSVITALVVSMLVK